MRRAAALADEGDPPAGAADPRRCGQRRGGRAGDPPAGERGRRARRADPRRPPRQRRSSKAGVPPSSAASWSRRVAAMAARPTSPTTAARLPWRTPFLHHRQHLLVVAAFGVEQAVRRQPRLRQAGREQIAAGERPEHLAVAPRAKRAAAAARNRVAAASSPGAGAAAAASCSARPPARRRRAGVSTASIPKGRHGRAPPATPARSMRADLGAQGGEACGSGRRSGHATRTLLFALCSASFSRVKSRRRTGLDIARSGDPEGCSMAFRDASASPSTLRMTPLHAAAVLSPCSSLFAARRRRPERRRCRLALPGHRHRPRSGLAFGTLPNGLRYAVRRNALPAGQVSIRVRIDAGSLHEADE